MRCSGLPERESSWFSPWNRQMRDSTPWTFSAENIWKASTIQQRKSSSEWMNSVGVVHLSAYLSGECHHA